MPKGLALFYFTEKKTNLGFLNTYKILCIELQEYLVPQNEIMEPCFT